MRLDLFVKLKYESTCIILFISIRYCVTYFLTSITMPGLQTSDMRQIQ